MPSSELIANGDCGVFLFGRRLHPAALFLPNPKPNWKNFQENTKVRTSKAHNPHILFLAIRRKSLDYVNILAVDPPQSPAIKPEFQGPFAFTKF